MAIFKRGSDTWWVRFTSPSGQQIRESTQTTDRKAALEYHDRLKTEYWQVEKLGAKPKYTWQQAATRWLEETTHKASHRDDIFHLRVLHSHLYDKTLEEITRDIVDRFIKQRKTQDVSNATVNRSLALLKSILKRAEREWAWLEKIPAIKLLPEPKRRVRWLTQDAVTKLMQELPPHLAEMVCFTLATGLRERNVTHLEWSQVDLERSCLWIHPDQAKARKAIPVPLNTEAVALLRKQLGKHLTRVFTYKGNPVAVANTRAWRNALTRAGIENFRWHDLRHTWATWHVQNGTPLHALQELGGWANHEMVQRYAHLSAEHLAEYAKNLASPRIISTNLAHSAQAQTMSA